MMCTNAWEIRVIYMCFETKASHVAINYELFITCTFLQLAKVRMARVKKKC